MEKDILSLDDFQIKPKNLLGDSNILNKNTLQQSMSLENNFKFELQNPENSCFSEQSRDFLKQMAPEPVKVFNNMVKLKRISKNKNKNQNFHMVLKFDNIITDDYMTTFYDMSVVLKLYSDLEFFIKGLLYTNIGEIYKQISPFSNEYNYIFGLDSQKKDFNLHYHKDLPELNTENDQNSQNNTKEINTNENCIEPAEKTLKQKIENMKFTKIELSSNEIVNKKPLQIHNENTTIETEAIESTLQDGDRMIEEEVEKSLSKFLINNNF